MWVIMLLLRLKQPNHVTKPYLIRYINMTYFAITVLSPKTTRLKMPKSFASSISIGGFKTILIRN